MTGRQVGLIAILRGVTPGEVVEIASAVLDAGFDAVEVPLNSPDPLESIRRMSEALPGGKVGAGTVLTCDEARAVADAGASFVVSPNTRTAVIELTSALGLGSYPGVATPSEAFAALDAGASGLKLFPASTIGIEGMQAWASVLPQGTPLIPVGGVSIDNLGAWARAGAAGAGVGSLLYRPGTTAADAADRAARLVTAWNGA